MRAILWLMGATMIAQSTVTQAMAQGHESAANSSWTNQAWQNFKSPVTTDAQYILIGGATATAALMIFGDPSMKGKPLGNFSKYAELGGRGYANGFYIAGMLTYGLMESDDTAKQNAFSMLQATFYSSLVTTGLKYTVKEKRPDSTATESFPSGHTTAAFSFASYVACRHALGWGIAAYSSAVLVGLSRVNDQRHFFHDVTAGAAIGAGYGLGVCLSENARRESSEKKSNLSWFTAPSDGGLTAGFNIRLE